jgi:hypothetical protein
LRDESDVEDGEIGLDGDVVSCGDRKGAVARVDLELWLGWLLGDGRDGSEKKRGDEHNQGTFHGEILMFKRSLSGIPKEQGLKPALALWPLVARLKPCPCYKTATGQVLQRTLESFPSLQISPRPPKFLAPVKERARITFLRVFL